MFKKQFDNLPLWQFNNLSSLPFLRHYVSTREGGFSNGAVDGLNLSYKVGDDSETVQRNRALLASSLRINPSQLIFPDQTHSSNIQILETGNEDTSNTDALITSSKNICISVMSADCVPVLLCDPAQNVIAAIHAGWRGTVGSIVVKTIEKMRKEFNVEPSNIVACIGPSICDEVYEVGSEVIEEMVKCMGSKEGIVVKEDSKTGKGFLNLWEANKRCLIQAGVLERNIEMAGVCTYKNSDIFYSARKSNNKTGRFAAGIMIL